MARKGLADSKGGSSSSTQDDYGRARLEPMEPVMAGRYGTWRLVYTVGQRRIATGGKIRVSTDSDTDWGWPQCDHPAGPDYVTLLPPAGTEVALVLPDHKSILIVVTGRPLEPGDEIAVTYGDRAGGSPGSRVQTFLESMRYFAVEVDAEGTGAFVPVADPPHLSVVGGNAVRLVLIAPSDAVIGTPIRLLLKAEDEWGNPAEAYRGQPRLEAAACSTPTRDLEFTDADGGAKAIEGCVMTAVGTHRITATDPAHGLATQSNPIVVRESAPRSRLYWGDPHGGQVVDPRKIDVFFRYARDVAGIDFVGFQRNDDEMTDDVYAQQQRYERQYHQPGRFVPLPGYEWSANAASGGHHNVYQRRFGRPIRRSRGPASKAEHQREADLLHVLDLHRAYRHSDVVITPHVGGTPSDLTYHEPMLEPAIEVTSTHGTFEWFLREALERRYELGFLGGSDCYTGRPGDDRPGYQLRRYAKAGLTGVYADALTVDSVLEAIKSRRCYATTGARIIAAVAADGHAMGTKYATRHQPNIHVSVAGTAPLEAVELYRGLERLYKHDLHHRFSPTRVRILWEGASRKSSYSGIVWDGCVRVVRGTIAGVDKIRFDSPRSNFRRVDDGELQWQSWTCGYKSGLMIELHGSPDTRIELAVSSSLITGALFGGYGAAPPARMAFSPAERIRLNVALADLAPEPRTIDLGVLDRKISIGLAPEPGAESAEFSFRDPSVAPGINPYWIKVTQMDMEMAWTSPVFVDYVANPEEAVR